MGFAESNPLNEIAAAPVSRVTLKNLPRSDAKRERVVQEAIALLRRQGFTVDRIGHRSWSIAQDLSTTRLVRLARAR